MTTHSSHTTTAVTTIIGTVTITIVIAKAIITNLITRAATKEALATVMEVVKAEVVIKVVAVTEETMEAILAVVLHINQAVVVMTTMIVVLGTTDLRVAPIVVETTGTSTRAATAAMIATYRVKVDLVVAIKVAETITITTMTETTIAKEATLPMTDQAVNNKIVDLNAVIPAMDIVVDIEVVIKVVETMETVVATITTMDTTTTIRTTGNSTVEVTIANLPTVAVITRETECKDVIRGVVADHPIRIRMRLTRPLMNRKASENYEQNATYD